MKRIFLAVVLLAAGALAHGQSAMRIQYAEPVSIATGTGHSSFDAYGRRFDLTLANNERVTSKFSSQRKAELARYRVLRGTLAGQAHSWVRLTEFNGRLEGAIWDGRDLYAVTSLDRISANLVAALPGAPTQTVIYRLSDSINAFPKNFCADAVPLPGEQPDNGLVQYRAMVAELSAQTVSAASIVRQIEISLIGDATFQAKFPSDAMGELLARHNVADGVYAEQVGLLIVPTDLRLAPGNPDPFTSTDPQALLDQLSTFRRGNTTVKSMGLAHLMTGRVFNDDVVGIANLGGVCDTDRGVSLTESSLGSTIDGLVMAHELGHNFGAVHDGTGVCASTSRDYLMSPTFNFSATFSQCSLDTIRPVIQSASCIVPADYGDVELAAAGPALVVENDVPLVVPYIVSSTGTQTARNASLEVSAPQDFTIIGATAGTCSFSSGVANCAFGDIPAGQQRNVTVTLLPAHIGTYYVDARVRADNNPSTHNDAQRQQVDVVINVDAKVTMTASAGTILVGDPVDLSVVVASLRSHDVHGATLNFYHPLLEVNSVTVSGGSCIIDSFQTNCTLNDIPGGASRTITFHATGRGVGLAELNAVLNVTPDAVSENDYAHVSVRVNPVRDVGVDEVTPNIVSGYGQPFEFRANLHSYGTQSINDVRLFLDISTPHFGDQGIDSVAIAGVNCAPLTGTYSYDCTLGTLAPGELRAVVVQGHGASLGTYAMSLRVSATGDQNSINDTLVRGVTVKNAVDVAIVSPTPLSLPEGQEGYGTVLTVSNGSQAVGGVTFDVTAPAALRFTRLYLPPDKGACTILADQHFRCTLAFAANNASGSTSINYFLVGNAPGSYNLAATITAANDELPSNDSMTLPVTITPLVNVGVRDMSGPAVLGVGSDATFTATVFTGSNPVPGATAIVVTFGGAEIASMTTGAGSCARTGATRFECALGDLPGGAAVPLSISVHGNEAASSTSLSINANAPTDNNPNDNIRTLGLQVVAPGEVRVSAPASATATAGVGFNIPITLRHTGSLVQGHLKITLPAGLTLSSISAGALVCSGTTVLDCDLSEWPESQAFEVRLNLQPAAAGSYTVSAKVSSLNDTDGSNNDSSISVTVAAAAATPTPPSGGGGGGGGGGSFEWVSLTALMAMFGIRRRGWRCRYGVPMA